MASNLECVGLAVADRGQFGRLVESALAGAELVGVRGGVSVYRWQDLSGARLVIATRGGEVVDLLPSFAGAPGARLADVRAVNDDVAVAAVVDEAGEVTTMLAVELEQRRLLDGTSEPIAGEASVVALGVDVSVHADEEAFAASDASLLSPGGDSGEPPAHVVEQGMPWPPRMGAESFISYGVFGPPEQAQAYARLHGTVLEARPLTAEATRQSFIAARVRTVGFDVDLCIPATAGVDPPRAGNVVGGEVFLVASMPGLVTSAAVGDGPARRSWLPWRRP